MTEGLFLLFIIFALWMFYSLLSMVTSLPRLHYYNIADKCSICKNPIPATITKPDTEAICKTCEEKERQVIAEW